MTSQDYNIKVCQYFFNDNKPVNKLIYLNILFLELETACTYLLEIFKSVLF